MARRKILFVSHDASRTGATILLLHFLEWLRANSDLDFEVLLKNAGEMEPSFAAVAPSSVLHERPTHGAGLASRIARRLPIHSTRASMHRRAMIGRLERRGFDLVYSNTITNGAALEALSVLGCPALTHVHELESWIRRCGTENLDQVKRHTRRYVACAEAVKSNLVEHHGIAGSVIDVVHGFVPTAAAAETRPRRSRAEVLGEIGIPADACIVGAAGTTDWRKGPDLFVQLARVVRRMRPELPAHFVWLGGAAPGDPVYDELRHDVVHAGLAGRVHFLGPKVDPLNYFRTLDVFALVSREDPYPLVCLEAGALGKPIVCFDGAGGESEFVEDDAGFVLPYLDVEAMAAACVRLLETPELRARLGARAQAKVTERHDVGTAAPKLLAVIEGMLA